MLDNPPLAGVRVKIELAFKRRRGNFLEDRDHRIRRHGFRACPPLTLAGHDAFMTARNLTEAEKIAKQIGPRVKVVPAADIAKGVDILIAATPAGEKLKAAQASKARSSSTFPTLSSPTCRD